MKLLLEIGGFRQSGEKVEEGGTLYVLNIKQRELFSQENICLNVVDVEN